MPAVIRTGPQQPVTAVTAVTRPERHEAATVPAVISGRDFTLDEGRRERRDHGS